VNIFRRLPLIRLLIALVAAVAVGVSATALAFALGGGPTPPAKPLADAIHDALAGSGGEAVQGISANITFTDHLLEGASLASGGKSSELSSSPLITGASGRLWIAKSGDMRLELQSETGDTEILYDGHTLQLYDAATNTLYRYTPPAREAHPGEGGGASGSSGESNGEVPSVAKIEEAITDSSRHVDLSGATPTDIAGQPAYTVRVAPREGGSLLGGAELSFDANNGMPLRTAVYSSDSSSPVLELAVSHVSFGAVESSVFAITPPADAKVQEVTFANEHRQRTQQSEGERPKLTTHGHGPATVAVLASPQPGEAKSKGTGSGEESLEGLSKVTINGTTARELRTELGTLLTFERSGVRYLLAGAVAPATIEEVARGL
jgi:outer membrane lipoprotein-sorting protein